MSDQAKIEAVFDALTDLECEELSDAARRNWRSRLELYSIVLAVFPVYFVLNFIALKIAHLYFSELPFLRLLLVFPPLAILYISIRFVLSMPVSAWLSNRSLLREIKKRGLT